MEVFAFSMLFGSFWFWSYSIILFVALCIFVENTDDGSPLGGFFAFMLYNGLLWWHLDVPVGAVFSAINDNPGTTFVYLLSYFGIGTAWGTWKWYRVLKKAAKKLLKLKIKFCNNNNLDPNVPLPEKAKKEWKEFRDGHYSSWRDQPAPEAMQNKSRITSWMAFWPVSFFWFITADFLTNAWDWCYEFMSIFFGNMRKRIFKDLTDVM
jgi:hypothetical protein